MLVEPHQPDLALRGMGVAGHFLSALAVVLLHAHPHPPVAGGLGNDSTLAVR